MSLSPNDISRKTIFVNLFVNCLQSNMLLQTQNININWKK